VGCPASRRRSDRGPAHRSARQHRIQQRTRIVASQPPDHQLRQPRQVIGRDAGPEDHADRLLPRRRATNARTCAEARSSHCSSSTMHTSGRSSATSDSKPRTAMPTRKRSDTEPALRPNAGPQRVPLRPRESLQAVQRRRAQLMQHGKGQLHLRLDPGRPCYPASRRPPGQVLQQRCLAVPARRIPPAPGSPPPGPPPPAGPAHHTRHGGPSAPPRVPSPGNQQAPPRHQRYAAPLASALAVMASHWRISPCPDISDSWPDEAGVARRSVDSMEVGHTVHVRHTSRRVRDHARGHRGVGDS
jgi:hypothetical protein